MHNAKLIKKIFSLLVIFLLTVVVLAPISAVRVYARTAEEIQKEIDAKQKEINTLQSDLAKKQSDLAKANSQKQSAQNELASVQSDIESKKIEVEVIQLELDQLQATYDVQKLEKEQIERQQTEQLSSLYMNWKGNMELNSILTGNNDPIKQNYYLEIITETDQEGLNATYEKLAGLETDIKDVEAKREELNKKKADLELQQKTLQAVIDQNAKTIADTTSGVNGIRSKLTQSQAQKSELIDEKQQLEAEINRNTTGGQEQLVSGEMYFTGSVINSPGDPSTDAFGHGVGMSQWGAYGAAKAGWSASQILTFYYTKTQIRTSAGKNISVSGYGTMTVENYVSGLGEIPDYACGTAAQIASWKTYADEQGWSASDSRRNKYVLDNGNYWTCWPEEAIKAQVIVARSFGVTSTQPICTTAACQVYKGGTKKAWAAWETKDQYVYSTGSTHNGQIIRAFYSSYNSNGTGTADNDTIWGDNSGTGTVYSYLRSVNDSAFTYKYLGRTNWRTNSYTIPELNIMMNWCVNNCSTKSWFKASVKDKVGDLTSIAVSKEASGRVKKVTFKGTKGSATVSGRYFRTMFNKWINSSSKGVSKPSDNLKSITFSALTAS